MFLHLGNIMASLVKGQHLPVVDNHAANMEQLKCPFKVFSVVAVAVYHYEKLPELLAQGHARDIQARQLFIEHEFDQVVKLINLGRIERRLDKRTSRCGETVSRRGESSIFNISLEQEKDGQQGQDEQECAFEMR